jgi:TatD DNase family protein
MQLIDTHTHLYLPEFDHDRDEVVVRSVDSGVIKLLMPNIDIHSVDHMLATENKFAGICYSMSGLHPTSVKEDYLSQLDTLENNFTAHPYIAIGEIGIDLYWDKTFIEEQIVAFRHQLYFAVENNLPVVIHARESFAEIFAVLDEFRGRKLKGVLHAFTGGIGEAEKATGIGLKLGIGGIVTFKNSGLDRVVKETAIEYILLETDSPYLAPVPHRGKRNESSYICIINKRIADIKGITEEEAAKATFSNSAELFNLKG